MKIFVQNVLLKNLYSIRNLIKQKALKQSNFFDFQQLS